MLSTITLKDELEKAIENRINLGLDIKDFSEVLRRINQFDDGEKCSICGSKQNTMPKAGSGTVSHIVCLKCVMDRDLEVLPEYLENIAKFGHWHNPLEGALK